jgi:methylenetetrahydrofolate reductase (NADH)
MTTHQLIPSSAVEALLADFSLEMTGKDVEHLVAARHTIPQGTRVNVTYLEGEDLQQRLGAVRAVRDCGFVPVPHISARRLDSQQTLETYLSALAGERATDNVFVVAGDPATPHGPYADALAIIDTGLLEPYGVRHISVSGYPEGHPDIAEPVLWSALEDKASTLEQRGLPGAVITQFGFDADAVLGWIEQARSRGVTMPVRVGVPGPAGIKRLVRYAARFGVGTSAGIAKKYGFSITNLLGTAGPERFILALAEGYSAERHGEVKLHFYTFGGLGATSRWIEDFKTGALR